MTSLLQAWRKDLFTTVPWEKDPTRAVNPGEAGGFLVRATGFSHPGYLKPTGICPPAHPRAAHEKIVADLAADLGLPVPPVLLFRREPCPAGEEPRACVSLVLHSECYELHKLDTLAQAADAIRQVVRSVMARACGIIVLDTFVGNTDRNNGRNALFGIDPTEPAAAGFIFLDYANALNYGGQWEQDKARNVTLVSMPSLLRDSVDGKVIGASITALEALSDSAIDEIVDRISDDYMEPKYREVVKQGLKQRRGLVGSVVRTGLGL